MVYYLIQFVIMMTCIYAKLVSAAHMNRFIKSYYIYIYCFPCSLFENHVLQESQNHEKVSNYQI